MSFPKGRGALFLTVTLLVFVKYGSIVLDTVDRIKKKIIKQKSKSI